MKLNRHNYEEYFILYLDNELGSDDRREVELFAAENPDLKAELDMLLQSKLVPDTDITFTNKASLLVRDSSSININNYEEWLLSYVDNELSPEELKDVEQFIAEHPAVKTELGLLQKTKLQPEAIVFPDKESLYRHEEKAKVVVIHWRRWAVAAALLIGIGTTAIVLLNNKPGGGKTDLASQGQSVINTNTNNNTAKQPENTIPGNKEGVAGNEPQKIENTANITVTPVKQHSSEQKEKRTEQAIELNETKQALVDNSEKKKTNDLPEPIDNPYVNKRGDAATLLASADVPAKGALTNLNEIVAPPNVTPDKLKPSYTSNTPTEEESVDVDQPAKKNKLRGFFRKITRTFEKRTNIKATDDDDRLLIAGLAIKLN